MSLGIFTLGPLPDGGRSFAQVGVHKPPFRSVINLQIFTAKKDRAVLELDTDEFGLLTFSWTDENGNQPDLFFNFQNLDPQKDSLVIREEDNLVYLSIDNGSEAVPLFFLPKKVYPFPDSDHSRRAKEGDPI